MGSRIARTGGVLALAIALVWVALGITGTPAGGTILRALAGLVGGIWSGILTVAEHFGSTSVAGNGEKAILIGALAALLTVALIHRLPVALAVGAVVALLLYSPSITAQLPTITTVTTGSTGTATASCDTLGTRTTQARMKLAEQPNSAKLQHRVATAVANESAAGC